LQLKNSSNEEVVLRIVSFGTIGEELKVFCENLDFAGQPSTPTQKPGKKYAGFLVYPIAHKATLW
jgi:hypothetical protein